MTRMDDRTKGAKNGKYTGETTIIKNRSDNNKRKERKSYNQIGNLSHYRRHDHFCRSRLSL